MDDSISAHCTSITLKYRRTLHRRTAGTAQGTARDHGCGLQHQALKIPDTKGQHRTRVYWQDITIGFAASIFNGHSKAAGHHAHTARMLYDRHWHGRNRTENTKLSKEKQAAEAACHLCGATDSQSHALKSCQHSNIAAIRDQIYSALQDWEIHYQQEAKGNNGHTGQAEIRTTDRSST